MDLSQVKSSIILSKLSMVLRLVRLYSVKCPKGSTRIINPIGNNNRRRVGFHLIKPDQAVDRTSAPSTLKASLHLTECECCLDRSSTLEHNRPLLSLNSSPLLHPSNNSSNHSHLLHLLNRTSKSNKRTSNTSPNKDGTLNLRQPRSPPSSHHPNTLPRVLVRCAFNLHFSLCFRYLPRLPRQAFYDCMRKQSNV